MAFHVVHGKVEFPIPLIVEVPQEILELSEKSQKLDGSLRKMVTEGKLAASLSAAGVKPSLMKAAQRMFESDVEVLEEDGRFVARMKADLGGDDVERYISDWAQRDEAKDFIAPATGAGAQGGSGSKFTENPFDGSGGRKPNLTKQQILISDNPEKAKAMARAAGWSEAEIDW